MADTKEDNIPKEFPYEIKIRDKVFKYRSWKIKDKKRYLSYTAKIELVDSIEEKDKIVKGIRQSIVIDCLEGAPPITPDEYQFLLIAIRNKSISHIIEMSLDCPKCETSFSFELDLNTAVKADCDDFSTIIVENGNGKLRFKMGRIKSQEVYDDYLSKSESEFEALFVDFVQHVQSINDKVYTSEEKFILFNSVDVNLFEEIIVQWEKQRFKLDNIIGVVCTSCGHVEDVVVDDIPSFFPISWTE